MHVHLVGVCGTGMGSLAMLFRAQGHDVSGSDAAFDPPMGPALEAAGIRCLAGYRAENVDPAPDLVVVGNAIRKDNVEAAAVRERGLRATSMSGALREVFLPGRRPLVCAGTHGKTTTSTMCAWLLAQADLDPGYFIGGLPKDLPSGAAIGGAKRRLIASGAPGASPGKRAPFVLEGDEYDAVYWKKEPKFFDYVGVGSDDVVIVTSCEHDHVDIYPNKDIYEAQFAELFRRIPEGGLAIVDARDEPARRLALAHAKARVVFYALEGDDTGGVTPTWLGAPAGMDDGGMMPFDLFVGGTSAGRFAMHVPGAHNVRNAVAAIAACAEGFGVPLAGARSALASFHGVRRRQDLLGSPGGVTVYDDFAHHPTAVDETLRALRARHRSGSLWAVFEPRSATACRALHQEEYTRAFGAADRVLFAPLGRTNVPEGERLDLPRLARELGGKARAAASVDEIVDVLGREAKPGDVVALLSNGSFAGVHAKVLAALESRA